MCKSPGEESAIRTSWRPCGAADAKVRSSAREKKRPTVRALAQLFQLE
jgi:hypothetical protein